MPANVAAEESLIGAVLLSHDATHLPRVNDFFAPKHQFIADAIHGLHRNAQPIDIITVADELRRAGLDDEIGGIEYLNQLQDATPAISNMAAYSKIVRDAAALRRLYTASAEITDLVYSAPADVGLALARAQALVDSLDPGDTEIRSTLDIADLAALLATDMEPERLTIGKRSDGACLIYPGKMHSLIAESTTGKGWIALQWALEIMVEGGSVIYFDYEDSPRSIARRLLILGATRTMITNQFCYIRPEGKFGPAEKARLSVLFGELNPDLIIVDAWVGAMNREGLKEDLSEDIETWVERVARWMIRESNGAAMLILDHVTKDPETRGRYARGSGRKLEALDGCAYQVKVITPFSQNKAGLLRLVCGKDRGGNYFIGETVADIKVTPAGAGELLRVDVAPHTAELKAHDPWRPTMVMGQLAKAIADSAVQLTATGLCALFPSYQKKVVNQALTRLVAEGFVAESRGGRGRTRTLRLVQPFTEGGIVARPYDAGALFDGGVFDEPEHIADAEYRASLHNLDDYR